MKPEKNKTFLQRLIDAGVEAANYEDTTYIRQAERHLRNGEVKAANTAVKAGLAGAVTGALLANPFVKSMTAPEFFAWSQMQKLPVATRIASKVVPFLGSMVGGHAVNKASEKLTGKSFGENVYNTVSQALPNYVQNNNHVQAWGPVISEFLNPGYIAGGWATSKLPSTVSDIATNIAAKRAAAPKTSPKIEYSNWGGEFVDDVAVNSRQHYSPKQSKLSSGELQGLPKSMRVVETPEYLELKQVYNKFANKYGYPEATARTYDELVRESRKLLNRHNTFFRGVAMEEGLIERTPGMSSYERLKHAATQTYDGRTHLWVSPYSDYAGFYAGDNGGVFALRPQIKFDGKPISWFTRYDVDPKRLSSSWDDAVETAKKLGMPWEKIESTSVDDLIEIANKEEWKHRLIDFWNKGLDGTEYLAKPPVKVIKFTPGSEDGAFPPSLHPKWSTTYD